MVFLDYERNVTKSTVSELQTSSFDASGLRNELKLFSLTGKYFSLPQISCTPHS